MADKKITVKLVKSIIGTKQDHRELEHRHLRVGGLVVEAGLADVDVARGVVDARRLAVELRARAGAAFGNGVRGHLAASGTIIDDDFPPGTRFVLVGKDSASLGIRRYSSSGTYVDTWYLEGRKGQVAIITMKSEDFRPYLLLGRAPSGDATFSSLESEGAPVGEPAKITLELPANGRYWIRANTFDKLTGRYTLKLRVR